MRGRVLFPNLSNFFHKISTFDKDFSTKYEGQRRRSPCRRRRPLTNALDRKLTASSIVCTYVRMSACKREEGETRERARETRARAGEKRTRSRETKGEEVEWYRERKRMKKVSRPFSFQFFQFFLVFFR